MATSDGGGNSHNVLLFAAFGVGHFHNVGSLQQLVVDPKGAVIVRTWCRQLQQCAVSSEIMQMAGQNAPWETMLSEFANI